MELEIMGKNLDGWDSIQEYVKKKVEKLKHYLPKISEAKVEIREQKTKSPKDHFIVQVTLNNNGTLLRAEERAESVAAAVDAVYEALTRQIERYKGKLYKRERGVSPPLETAAEQIAGYEEEAAPKLVRVKRFAAKMMSVDEAAEQMELLGHDFFLFVNYDNNKMNLLYRRRDGDYGLIDPEVS
jgi:putative sigma-54 modulation protein